MKTFDEYKELAASRMTDYLPETGEYAKKLQESMEYSLMAGGKRLRPVLLLACCDFAGGSLEEALPYACAMEYIHTYSLIHDDLPAMDDDPLRRGKPTNHMVYGAGMATIAGDGLLSSAFEEMLLQSAEQAKDPEDLKNRVLAMAEIAQGAGVRGMVAGQAADISYDVHEGTPELLDFIHRNKTGAMIRGAVRGGLRLAGAGEEMLAAFTGYAEALGLAFQIADDILDETGTPEELGKMPHQDDSHDKLTYVSLFGMEKSEQRLHELTVRAEESLAAYGEDAAFFLDLVKKLEKRKH